MDLNRGIVKTLFYDYPVDALVQILDKSNDFMHDVFLDVMPQLMRWSKAEYTYTETNLLRMQIGGEWQDDNPTLYHPLDILKTITEKLLTTENAEPRVRFNQLFRWKETASYVGENVLTTAFMADTALKHHGDTEIKRLTWNDILPHNNHALNAVLREGLVDTHAHFIATADVFHLNWVSLMNNLSRRTMLNSRIKQSQDLELMTPKVDFHSTIGQQAIAAAYLRFVFFMIVMGGLKTDSIPPDAIEYDFEHKVLRVLKDRSYANKLATQLQNAINTALSNSLPTSSGHVDYCIVSTPALREMLETDNPHNVNLIQQGERQLLYKYFLGYYSGDSQCTDVAPYFYLYLLLQSKIRREFVQINRLKGFENFQTYQGRKGILIPKHSPIHKYYNSCVLNSSVQSAKNDRLEIRIAPCNLQYDSINDVRALFSNSYETLMCTHPQFDIVVHFIKKGKYDYATPTLFQNVGKIKDGTRDVNYRKEIALQIDKILHYRKIRNIVGIDAASSEIFCRPEVFGHVYRYAYCKGLQGRTYHVGEDFLDLPDGLRAIDEAILFLQLDEKCRIGHAMALGIDAQDYFERRHYTTIITKQYLLDNCIWLLMRGRELKVNMSEAFQDMLKEKALQLSEEIMYPTPWDINHYWHSMLLRGNDPEALFDQHSELIEWKETAKLKDDRVSFGDQDRSANNYYQDYFYDEAIKKNGMKLVQHKWDKEIVDVITDMQKKMQSLIAKKGICIECCPTSNLKIGFIDKYEQHPLLTRFYPIDADASYPLIKCSINTDDRGVFYTSIYEEYSLIALALYKMKDEKTGEPKYNEREILRYIGEIRKNAQQMAFHNYTDDK